MGHMNGLLLKSGYRYRAFGKTVYMLGGESACVERYYDHDD